MLPGRVKSTFERLEPCAVKVASTVLRGRGGSNVAPLPDVRHEVAWRPVARSKKKMPPDILLSVSYSHRRLWQRRGLKLRGQRSLDLKWVSTGQRELTHAISNTTEIGSQDRAV